MNKILQLSTRFRSAIVTALENDDFYKISPFNIFPRGCCDRVSLLLGDFLLQQGIPTFIINGKGWNEIEGYPENHVWLALADNKDVIIDITGDQFKYNKAFLCFDIPVYVGRETEFHKLFNEDITCKKVGFLERKQGSYFENLEIAYEKIKQYL